jgi:hypothetical protein
MKEVSVPYPSLIPQVNLELSHLGLHPRPLLLHLCLELLNIPATSVRGKVRRGARENWSPRLKRRKAELESKAEEAQGRADVQK